ncbi:hypothetical protein [Veillonella sp.]|uniref:hypothetical protein n=1 Tax=Veillonella sp. TaxID=1926307 RepID=UPI00257CE803|nr:hypothetical protein [Veillonella sp.]MBS6486403.1 hypothetical protein [Veillonella sp.]
MEFYKGQVLKNTLTGVVGAFIKEFKVTGKGISIKVMCIDGREYVAPKEEWKAA